MSRTGKENVIFEFSDRVQFVAKILKTVLRSVRCSEHIYIRNFPINEQESFLVFDVGKVALQNILTQVNISLWGNESGVQRVVVLTG